MHDTDQTACPHCNAVQRFAQATPIPVLTCTDCGEVLFNGQPMALNGATFAHHLEANSIPVLVDFWADWCAPCIRIAPELIKVAVALEPRVRFAKVDTDEEQKLAGHNGIRGFPTLVLYRGGHEISRQSGAMPASQIKSWIEGHL